MGLVQAANAAASSRHANDTPPSESVNVNDGLVELVGDVGPEAIVGGGGADESIVHVYEAAELVPAPEPSARTRNSWLPVATPEP